MKRQLSTVKEVVDEYDWVINLHHVKYCKNKADVLTKVNKMWLQKPVQEVYAVGVSDLHEQHHFSVVDWSLYLAQLLDPNIRN